MSATERLAMFTRNGRRGYETAAGKSIFAAHIILFLISFAIASCFISHFQFISNCNLEHEQKNELVF